MGHNCVSRLGKLFCERCCIGDSLLGTFLRSPWVELGHHICGSHSSKYNFYEYWAISRCLNTLLSPYVDSRSFQPFGSLCEVSRILFHHTEWFPSFHVPGFVAIVLKSCLLFTLFMRKKKQYPDGKNNYVPVQHFLLQQVLLLLLLVQQLFQGRK